MAVWGPDLIRDAAIQARLEYHVDVAAAALASGISPPPEPGGAFLRTEDYHRDGSCPLATLLDQPLPRHRAATSLLASDGSTTVGATAQILLLSGDEQGGPPGPDTPAGRTLHSTRLPLPPFMGTRPPNARFTEAQAGLRMVLECEAAGAGAGVMDAQTEWYVIQKILTMPLRKLLQRPNVAVALRTRAVLQRWAL